MWTILCTTFKSDMKFSVLWKLHITKPDLKRNKISQLTVLKKISSYLKTFQSRKLLTQMASLVNLFKSKGKSNFNHTETLLEGMLWGQHHPDN